MKKLHVSTEKPIKVIPHTGPHKRYYRAFGGRLLRLKKPGMIMPQLSFSVLPVVSFRVGRQ